MRSAVPESCYGLLNFLPALRNGETIAVGEGVSLPMRIRLAPLPAERRPKKRHRLVYRGVAAGRPTAGRIEETVERWRRGFRQLGGMIFA